MINEIKKSLKNELFDPNKRKTFHRRVQRDSRTGQEVEKEVKNENKVYDDSCSICMDNFQ